MSGAPHNRRRRRRADSTDDHGAGMERWLLTYSDMITLLMALFIILWAISSVNVSKFAELKQSLSQAFRGKVIQGGAAVLNGGPQALQPQGTQVPTILTPASLAEQIAAQISYEAQKSDLENLQRLEHRIDAYARAQGLSGEIRTSIDERGLVVHVLTDQLLFDTGKAVVKQRALPLLTRIASLLASARVPNPIRVEGNTDDVPISTSAFRSNWELSAARATAVLEVLLAHGVPASRLSAAGYADQRPVASNSTAGGRAANRRVDLVVLRRAVPLSGDALP